MKNKKDKYINNLHRNAFLRFRWFEKKVFLLPFGNILTASIIVLPTFNRTSKKLIVLPKLTSYFVLDLSYCQLSYSESFSYFVFSYYVQIVLLESYYTWNKSTLAEDKTLIQQTRYDAKTCDWHHSIFSFIPELRWQVYIVV